MIDAAIRAFDPTHVYTHSSEDSHQDHRNVHAASVVAARNVANLFCYQSPSSTVAYRPNLFVDISNHIDDKLRLVAVYESQTSRRVNLAADLLVATARYWGRYAGYVLAEPLIVFRQRIG